MIPKSKRKKNSKTSDYVINYCVSPAFCGNGKGVKRPEEII